MPTLLIAKTSRLLDSEKKKIQDQLDHMLGRAFFAETYEALGRLLRVLVQMWLDAQEIDKGEVLKRYNATGGKVSSLNSLGTTVGQLEKRLKTYYEKYVGEKDTTKIAIVRTRQRWSLEFGEFQGAGADRSPAMTALPRWDHDKAEVMIKRAKPGSELRLLTTYFIRDVDATAAAMARQGVKVRIVMMNPENEALMQGRFRLRKDHRHYVADVKEAAKLQLKLFRKEFEEEEKGDLTAYTSDVMPFGFFVQGESDEDGQWMLIGLFPATESYEDGPMLLVRPEETGLWALLEETWDATWKDSAKKGDEKVRPGLEVAEEWSYKDLYASLAGAVPGSTVRIMTTCFMRDKDPLPATLATLDEKGVQVKALFSNPENRALLRGRYRVKSEKFRYTEDHVISILKRQVEIVNDRKLNKAQYCDVLPFGFFVQAETETEGKWMRIALLPPGDTYVPSPLLTIRPQAQNAWELFEKGWQMAWDDPTDPELAKGIIHSSEFADNPDNALLKVAQRLPSVKLARNAHATARLDPYDKNARETFEKALETFLSKGKKWFDVVEGEPTEQYKERIRSAVLSRPENIPHFRAYKVQMPSSLNFTILTYQKNEPEEVLFGWGRNEEAVGSTTVYSSKSPEMVEFFTDLFKALKREQKPLDVEKEFS